MTSEAGVSAVAGGGITSDERWAAWVAKGAKRDRKTKTRAVALAMTVAAGLALWLTIALIFG